MVLLSFPAANRDPAMFADADKVVIDRKENRHAAFGLGIHRCVGSNLARLEMTVAVEELLKRIPEFSLAGRGDVVGGHGAGPAQAADPVWVDNYRRHPGAASARKGTSGTRRSCTVRQAFAQAENDPSKASVNRRRLVLYS